MGIKNDINKRIIFISIILILWVAIFLLSGRIFKSRDLWGLMLIGSALITFFGFLQMPGSVNEKGEFQESRIRLAIAATFIVSYVIYFGSVIYLDPAKDERTGELVTTFAKDMLPTLTNLLSITISFYFGSTAAIEIAGKLSKKHSTKTEDNI